MMSTPAAPLFYSKGGALYVSAPAGSPARKLTDGSFDGQPAPSPDLSHLAFVRTRSAGDYGGELWVLDLSPDFGIVGAPRRLVDPAALSRGAGKPAPMVAGPKWSPTGDRIAFVNNPTGGAVDGGILGVADAKTGELSSTGQNRWAEAGFAWAPDGEHIAWINARSDVRPVSVNVLTIGGASSAIATGTNASSVTYSGDGRKVLFTNGDSTGPAFTNSPFDLKGGGVYSVDVPAGAVAGASAPTSLLASTDWTFTDLAALQSGAVAFTATRQEGSASIQVLDEGSSSPRTIVTDITETPRCHESGHGEGSCYAPVRPVWGAGDVVAYVNTEKPSALMVTDRDNANPRRVDTDVDSAAWAPAAG